MRRFGLAWPAWPAVAAIFLAGCGAAVPAAQVTPAHSPSALGSPVASPVASPDASPSLLPSPAPTPTPAASPPPPASISCVGRPDGGSMVLIGGALYAVADPVHPRLLCTIRNTRAQLFTGDTFTYGRSSAGGFDVVLHSIGSGNESVIASFPLGFSQPWGNYAVWTEDAAFAASATQDTDVNGDAQIHVWLSSQRGATQVYSYPVPLADCICRFGLPPPALSFSPDGAYLLSGWPIGKGGFLAPLVVHRVSDQSLVQSFDASAVAMAIWAPTGHRLIMSGSGIQAWTPEGGTVPISTTAHLGAEASLSPDGLDAAYSNYKDPAVPTSLRVYTYDLNNKQERLLIDRLRSEVLFVKDGWVWYEEEVACGANSPTCPPWGTTASSHVFAMKLTAGAETPVVFAPGESPAAVQSGWTLEFGGGPASYWPNS